MKKVLLLPVVIFIVMLSQAFGQASCPIILESKITCIGANQYKYFIRWDNPTSGAKSIKVVIGNCLNECINATVDGDQTFYFTSHVTPVVIVSRHTGNSTCLGTVCSAPLDMKVGALSAKKTGNTITLLWPAYGTKGEDDFFSVERSTDGKNFSQVGMVSVEGVGSYTFTDKNVPYGKVFYRVYVDGTYSTVLPIDLGTEIMRISQSGKVFTLNNVRGKSLVIMNTIGQQMLKRNLNNDFEHLDLSSYKPGVYMLVITDGRSEPITQKVMVR